MVSRGRGDDSAAVTSNERTIKLGEPIKEVFEFATDWRQMPANAHLFCPQRSRKDGAGSSIASMRNGQALRQPFIELFVNPAKKLDVADRFDFGQALFDFFLNFDMGQMLELQGALLWIAGKVSFESRLNIARSSLMPLNQIGIVTIHRAHEFNNTVLRDWVKCPSKP